MNFKETFQFYRRDEEFFLGQPMHDLVVDVAVSYALKKQQDGEESLCDKVLLDACRDDTITAMLIDWYFRVRGIRLEELIVNSEGKLQAALSDILVPSESEPEV